MMLQSNLCFIFLPPLISTTTFKLGSNVTIGSKYRSESGVARVGTPIRKINASVSIGCTMECNDLGDCESFNVISNGDGSYGFLCQFFDTLVEQSKVNMENSIYYEMLTNERDCFDIMERDYPDNRRNGIYLLALSDDHLITGVCDMHTDDGGWTLLQRRFKGSVDFFPDWQSYKNGFGDLNGEFWLGLENAHLLMNDTNTTLRFDLWYGTDHYYQEYYQAMISYETLNYQLTFERTSGTAGDSMTISSKNRMFTTKDKDNDEHGDTNCANRYHGAWWYSSCHFANLNGKYDDKSFGKGVNWFSLTGHSSSLAKTEIKVKRNP